MSFPLFVWKAVGSASQEPFLDPVVSTSQSLEGSLSRLTLPQSYQVKEGFLVGQKHGLQGLLALPPVPGGWQGGGGAGGAEAVLLGPRQADS